MELSENCLLTWEEGEIKPRYRLLWVNPKDGRHYFILAEGTRAWPIWRSKEQVDSALAANLIKVVEDDIMASLCHEAALSKRGRVHYEAAYALIKDLVEDTEHKIFDPALCGQLVRSAAAAHNRKRGTVYKHLRRYWQRGQRPISVQPDFPKCGKQGSLYRDPEAPKGEKRGRKRKVTPGEGKNITTKDAATFKQYIEEKYLKPGHKPLRLIWEMMLEERYELKKINVGDDLDVLAAQNKLPSFGQFRYYFRKNYCLTDVIKAREGDLVYLRQFRPTIGDATKQAPYPGFLYQIDSTTGDICLVSSDDPELLIGRPIVYLVVDTLTTMVVGLHVTFENPCYNVAALALWNAYCDKVKFCAEFGISIKLEEWPSAGLPTFVLADRGEMLTHVSDGLIKKLGVQIANTAPYRAESKPLVERMFQMLNKLTIRWLPGAKPQGEDPSKDDYRKLARLSVKTFMQDLIECVLVYNGSVKTEYWLDKVMSAAGVQLRPIALWAWGKRYLTGMMKHMDDASVRVGLLPTKTATVTPSGIQLGNLFYEFPPSVADDWPTRARTRGTWPLEFCSYDPNCVDYIFLPGKRPQDFQICHLTEKCSRGHAGRTWFEFQKWLDEQKVDKNHGFLKDLVARAEARERIAQHHQAALEAQGDAAVPDGKKLDPKGIRKNREIEKERMRQEEAEKVRRLLESNGLTKPANDSGKPAVKQSKADAAFYDELEKDIAKAQSA